MSHVRSTIRSLVGLVTVGSVLALAACAPESESTPTPTRTPAAPETSAPEPYAGPSVFVGDELDWFLLTSDEIAATIPGAADITQPAASLRQVSDGYGAELAPEICGILLSEASLGSVGARTINWSGAAGDAREGVLHVLQFADADQAQRRMDDYVAAAAECAQFTLNAQASSFANTAIDDGDGVRAVAGALILDFDGATDSDSRQYYGIASVGNVLVEFWQPFVGDPTLDTAVAAQLLHDRAAQAQDLLVGDLTANPPVPRDAAVGADPAGEWSAWEIGFDGIGPLPLGEEIDTVVAIVPDAEVIAPAAGGTGEWKLDSATGGMRLTLMAEEGGAAVATIRAGDIATGLYGNPPVDGALLPRAGGVGIGDSVENAIAAFPGGTSVHVIAAGLDFYEVSTRDGRVLLFHTDGAVAEAGSTIVGITTEDGLLRREYYFGAGVE